jgi:hypothetical protein
MADKRQAKQPAKGGGWRPVLRRMDQAAVAALVALSLFGMGVYWVVQGGPRGELLRLIGRSRLRRGIWLILIRRNGRSLRSSRILARRWRSGLSIHVRLPVRFETMTICGECAGLGRGRWKS